MSMFCMPLFPAPIDRSSTISLDEEDLDDIDEASLSVCGDFLIGTIQDMNLLLLVCCCCGCCDVVSDFVDDILKGDFFLVGIASISDVDADVVGSWSSVF